MNERDQKDKIGMIDLRNPAALAALLNGRIEDAMTASQHGGIEDMERLGQIDQSTKTTLPKEMGSYREAFKKLGFKFLGHADDLFFQCQFPKGWKKVPTDHAMRTDLVDDQGRRRGSIFYKAAIYDLTANVHLVPRYNVIGKREEDARTQQQQVVDWDGSVLFETPPTAIPDWTNHEEAKERHNDHDRNRDVCLAWLEHNKPKYEDVLAYW